MSSEMPLISLDYIYQCVLHIRNQRVILDTDLARLYGVTTKRLNEQVKRNIGRFPIDFMFQLIQAEKQEVVAKCDHLEQLKFSKTLPYAFTEHGAIMVASVLNTPLAIETSIFVVRAFVKLRQTLAKDKELHRKLMMIENRLEEHDDAIKNLVKVLHKLMENDLPVEQKKRTIGFKPWEE